MFEQHGLIAASSSTQEPPFSWCRICMISTIPLPFTASKAHFDVWIDFFCIDRGVCYRYDVGMLCAPGMD